MLAFASLTPARRCVCLHHPREIRENRFCRSVITGPFCVPAIENGYRRVYFRYESEIDASASQNINTPPKSLQLTDKEIVINIPGGNRGGARKALPENVQEKTMEMWKFSQMRGITVIQ